MTLGNTIALRGGRRAVSRSCDGRVSTRSRATSAFKLSSFKSDPDPSLGCYARRIVERSSASRNLEVCGLLATLWFYIRHFKYY